MRVDARFMQGALGSIADSDRSRASMPVSSCAYGH